MKTVSEWSNEELQNLIANYRRLEKTDAPCFAEFLEELSRRKGQGLDFDTTMRAVLTAARERRFLSYKQLADASGVEWSKVHYSMNRHLGELIEYAHLKGWPLLTAIIVTQANLDTGNMESTTLKGFVTAARELGYAFADDEVFLKEQQAGVFEWAQRLEENP